FEARDPLGGVPFYNLNRCADGTWIQLGCQNPTFARKALVALGLGHLLEDPKWAGVPRRFHDDAHRTELMELIRQRMASKSSAEWMAVFHEQDVPAAPVLTTEEFMNHPQVQANDLVVSLNDLSVGPIRQIGLLARFSATPGAVQGPAPRPGQDTEAVLQELSGQRSGPWSQPASPPPAKPGQAPRYALEDIRVLDLSAFLAGPTAGRLLADLGCDVIKVEPPEGDNFRLMAAGFIGANRGKRGIVLDLKSPEGLELFRRLVATADVVHQNFRPGVAERLGVDYETVRQINPRIIYSHSTAFGPRGPDTLRPAYDPVVSALSGIMAAQAGAENPPAHYQISDLSTGLAAATAVCMAVVARDRTGLGQLAETNMIASAGYVNSEWFTDYRGRSTRRIADRGQHGLSSIYRLYQAQSGWVFLGCALPEHWEALRSQPDLEGLRSVTCAEAGDPENLTLAAALGAFFRLKAAEEWEQELPPLGVPCVVAHRPLREVLFGEPRFRDVGLVVDLEHPIYGKLAQTGLLVYLSETPGHIARPEPALGQHMAEVLGELGMTASK
ncbi:MAG TPA: CoA transferase, partial [Dehalococcoidia bacterium]|nr:CoA transferase [Dehalococcoidia bacterium]